MTCTVRNSLVLLLALTLAIAGATAAFASGEEEAAAAMGELSPPGVVPIFEEPVTMTAFVSYTRTIVDFEANEMTKWMEEQTNIHWEWDAVNSSEDAKAKFTLVMNSGAELPDMMMGMNITHDEKHLYGSQGLFIPLNDIIEEHGFYINDVVKAAPNFLKESAGPDGNVYVLTAYEECYHCGVAQKMWINQVWLTSSAWRSRPPPRSCARCCARSRPRIPTATGSPTSCRCPGSPTAGTRARGRSC